MDEKLYNASCIFGHEHRASRSEMVSLFGMQLVEQIDAGEVVNAPILPNGECYDCKLELERRDRRLAVGRT